jgi:hypothetical protein
MSSGNFVRLSGMLLLGLYRKHRFCHWRENCWRWILRWRSLSTGLRLLRGIVFDVHVHLVGIGVRVVGDEQLCNNCSSLVLTGSQKHGVYQKTKMKDAKVNDPTDLWRAKVAICINDRSLHITPQTAQSNIFKRIISFSHKISRDMPLYRPRWLGSPPAAGAPPVELPVALLAVSPSPVYH